jgi:hypothetical protein
VDDRLCSTQPQKGLFITKPQQELQTALKIKLFGWRTVEFLAEQLGSVQNGLCILGFDELKGNGPGLLALLYFEESPVGLFGMLLVLQMLVGGEVGKRERVHCCHMIVIREVMKPNIFSFIAYISLHSQSWPITIFSSYSF